MENTNMFCFQCEQTAGCAGCTGRAGVCGKKAETAQLQDKLTGALVGLARAVEGNEALVTKETDKLVVEGLFTTITNVNFDDVTAWTTKPHPPMFCAPYGKSNSLLCQQGLF